MSKTPPGPKELALRAMREANIPQYANDRVEVVYKRAVNVLKKSAAKRARKK